MPNRPPREAAAILVVGVALLADTLIYFMLVPLLPGYATRFHLGPMGVGFLVWSYAAALLLSTFPLGRLLESRGRRGPMLLGLALLGATTLLFAVADSYPLLVTARVLQGVSATLTWVTGMAFLADCTPPEHRGRAMGAAFAFANAGVLAGPPLAGWLTERWGPQSPFVAAALLVMLDAVARLSLLRDPERRPGIPLGLKELLRDPAVCVLAGAMALGAALTTLLETVLPVHFDRVLGLRPSTVGLLFGLSAGLHMATSPLMGALSDRLGRRRLMRTGFALSALLVPATVLVRQPVPLAMVMAAEGFIVSLCISPVSPALADAVDARGSTSYAAVFGILNLAYAIGMLAGPLLGSTLHSLLGLVPAMVLLGASFLVFVPLLRAVKK